MYNSNSIVKCVRLVLISDIKNIHIFVSDKICVPQVAVKPCHKMVEQAKTIGVNLECVPARDRYNFLYFISFLFINYDIEKKNAFENKIPTLLNCR